MWPELKPPHLLHPAALSISRFDPLDPPVILISLINSHFLTVCLNDGLSFSLQLEICSVCYSSLVSFQIRIGLNESESCGSCVVILVVTNSRYIIVCVVEKVHNDRQACVCVLSRAYYWHLNVDNNMLHHTKIPLCSGIFHKQNLFFAAADQTFHNRLRCAEPPHYNQMHGWSHLTCVCSATSLAVIYSANRRWNLVIYSVLNHFLGILCHLISIWKARSLAASCRWYTDLMLIQRSDDSVLTSGSALYIWHKFTPPLQQKCLSSGFSFTPVFPA